MFKINYTLESIFGLTNTTSSIEWNRFINDNASERKKDDSFIGQIGNLIFSRTVGSDTMNIETINQ